MEEHTAQGVCNDYFLSVYWRVRRLGIDNVATECDSFIDVPKLHNLVVAVGRLSTPDISRPGTELLREMGKRAMALQLNLSGEECLSVLYTKDQVCARDGYVCCDVADSWLFQYADKRHIGAESSDLL